MKKQRNLFVILLCLCLLCACSAESDKESTAEEIRWTTYIVGDRSANMYEAIYQYEKKPAEHLYAYTIEMPETIRAELAKKYAPRTDRIGYLIPVYYPEHYEGAPLPTYLCTIHQDGAKMTEYVIIQVDDASGKVLGLDGFVPRDIDFQLIAGYTSPETPMYLYFENMNYYAVIGDRAYCFNNLPSMVRDGPARTDSFVADASLTVADVAVVSPTATTPCLSFLHFQKPRYCFGCFYNDINAPLV